MSYDLEALHAKSGIKIGSVRFATGTDLAGTAVIPAVANAAAVIHQIYYQASAFASLTLGRATGGATTYWQGLGVTGFLPVLEPTRIVGDSGGSVVLEGTSGVGSGVFRVWFTYESTPSGGGLSL